MEAWLKFRAEGVTRNIGLSIGSLVFQGLNTVEIILAICIVIMLIRIQRKKYNIKKLAIIIVPMAMLFIQTFYLLPALDERIQLILNNKPTPESKIHLLYVVSEVIKMVGLFWAGSKILNYYNININK